MHHLYYEMQKTLKQLQTLFVNFSDELETLPMGSLSCKKRKDHVYYYRIQWIDEKQYKTFLTKKMHL